VSEVVNKELTEEEKKELIGQGSIEFIAVANSYPILKIINKQSITRTMIKIRS